MLKRTFLWTQKAQLTITWKKILIKNIILNFNQKVAPKYPPKLYTMHFETVNRRLYHRGSPNFFQKICKNIGDINKEPV